MSATRDRHILNAKIAALDQQITRLTNQLIALPPDALDDRARLEESRRLLQIKLDTVRYCIEQDRKHGRYK